MKIDVTLTVRFPDPIRFEALPVEFRNDAEVQRKEAELAASLADSRVPLETALENATHPTKPAG